MTKPDNFPILDPAGVIAQVIRVYGWRDFNIQASGHKSSHCVHNIHHRTDLTPSMECPHRVIHFHHKLLYSQICGARNNLVPSVRLRLPCSIPITQ